MAGRLCTVLLVAVALSAGAADDETAVAEALSHEAAGRFAEARALLEAPAQAGNASASYHLGLMDARGEGGQRDLARAFERFRAAAARDHAHAQFLVGNMYLRGDGVAADPVQAHLWLSLAAANGWWKARELRERLVAERMTPAQVAEAARLFRERRPPQPGAGPGRPEPRAGAVFASSPPAPERCGPSARGNRPCHAPHRMETCNVKPNPILLACTALMPILHLCGAGSARADDVELWDRLRGGGYVLVVRLPAAPGAPAALPSSRGGCVTQRESGDVVSQAVQRIGEAFRERGVPLARVVAPPVCALLESARLAFGSAEAWTVDDGDPSRHGLAHSLASAMPAQGNLVFVTDKRTISELTGRTVTVGEFVVLAVDAGGLDVRGQLQASR